jgi:hypothetical protein
LSLTSNMMLRIIASMVEVGTSSPTVLASPGSQSARGEPEALFAEARERRRARRRRLAALAAIGVATATGFFLAFFGSGGRAFTVQSVERDMAASIGRSRGLMLSIRHLQRGVRLRSSTLIDLATGARRDETWNSADEPQLYTISYLTRSLGSSMFALHQLSLWPSSRRWSPQVFQVGSSWLAPQNLCACDPTTVRFRQATHRHVALLGEQRIDGQATYHLRLSFIGLDRTLGTAPIHVHTAFDIWVNKTSLLPVRLTFSRDGHLGYTRDYAWLRPTPARLASLRVTVPRGFHALAA